MSPIISVGCPIASSPARLCVIATMPMTCPHEPKSDLVRRSSGKKNRKSENFQRNPAVHGELEPRRGHLASPACHRETTQSCEEQRFHGVTNRVHLTYAPDSVEAWVGDTQVYPAAHHGRYQLLCLSCRTPSRHRRPGTGSQRNCKHWMILCEWTACHSRIHRLLQPILREFCIGSSIPTLLAESPERPGLEMLWADAVSARISFRFTR